MSMKMGRSIHLKTAGEGQYLKALLEYTAGRRDIPPDPNNSRFGLEFRPDRVEAIRDYADGLSAAMRGHQSRSRRRNNG